MELTGLLQMAPFRGMKEEELVAFLFGLPNSLKHFEPGDIIARQGDLCKGLYILASGSVRAGMINDEGKELTNEFALLNLKTRLLKYLETHSVIHNQQEVAQKLGVTRPSLARALSELVNEGKIKK